MLNVADVSDRNWRMLLAERVRVEFWSALTLLKLSVFGNTMVPMVVPAATVVPPEYVLAPPRVKVPKPAFSVMPQTVPDWVMAPEKARLPVGRVMPRLPVKVAPLTVSALVYWWPVAVTVRVVPVLVPVMTSGLVIVVLVATSMVAVVPDARLT